MSSEDVDIHKSVSRLPLQTYSIEELEFLQKAITLQLTLKIQDRTTKRIQDEVKLKGYAIVEKCYGDSEELKEIPLAYYVFVSSFDKKDFSNPCIAEHKHIEQEPWVEAFGFKPDTMDVNYCEPLDEGHEKYIDYVDHNGAAVWISMQTFWFCYSANPTVDPDVQTLTALDVFGVIRYLCKTETGDFLDTKTSRPVKLDHLVYIFPNSKVSTKRGLSQSHQDKETSAKEPTMTRDQKRIKEDDVQ